MAAGRLGVTMMPSRCIIKSVELAEVLKTAKKRSVEDINDRRFWAPPATSPRSIKCTVEYRRELGVVVRPGRLDKVTLSHILLHFRTLSVTLTLPQTPIATKCTTAR